MTTKKSTKSLEKVEEVESKEEKKDLVEATSVEDLAGSACVKSRRRQHKSGTAKESEDKDLSIKENGDSKDKTEKTEEKKKEKFEKLNEEVLIVCSKKERIIADHYNQDFRHLEDIKIGERVFIEDK